MSGRSAIAPAVLDTIATMREAGAPYSAIGRATGVNPKTCQYHALALGGFAPVFTTYSQGRGEYVRAGRLVRPFSANEDAAIVRWELQGLTLHEMGRRLGRSHSTVLHRLRALARHDAELEASA